MNEVTPIKTKPDRICLDCGKLFMLAHARLEETTTICPRCSSTNHSEYVEAQHQDINIEVPEGYKHPLEQRAQAIYDRLAKLTGWREGKIRLWFQLPNPMLGNVSPEFMIMAGEDRCARLEKFITEAEELEKDWRERAGKQDNGS